MEPAGLTIHDAVAEFLEQLSAVEAGVDREHFKLQQVRAEKEQLLEKKAELQGILGSLSAEELHVSKRMHSGAETHADNTSQLESLASVLDVGVQHQRPMQEHLEQAVANTRAKISTLKSTLTEFPPEAL